MDRYEENIEGRDLFEEFTRFQSARKDWIDTAVTCQDFRYGEQWTPEQKKVYAQRGQAAVSYNVIHPAIEYLKSVLTDRNPKFQAVPREDSDQRTAAVATMLQEYVFDISRGREEVKRFVDDFATIGLGIFIAYINKDADFGRGEVMIKSINPLDVFPDPLARDIYWRDASKIFIYKNLSKTAILSLDNDLDPESLESAIESYNTNETVMQTNHMSPASQGNTFLNYDESFYNVIECFQKVWHPILHVKENPVGNERELFGEEKVEEYMKRPAFWVSQDGGEMEPVIQETLVGELTALIPDSEILQAPDGQEYYKYIKEPPEEAVQQALQQGAPPPEPIELLFKDSTFEEMVEKEVIEANMIEVPKIRYRLMIGELIIQDEVLEISEYPVVPGMAIENRNTTPISDVSLVMDMQRSINKSRSIIMTHAANSANMKVLLPRGGFDRADFERRFNQPGVGVFEYDAELGAPTFMVPPALSAEFYHNYDRDLADIERTFGVYSVMMGDPSSAPVTHKGTMAIEEFGQKRVKSKQATVEGALSILGRSVLEHARIVYTREKTMRIVTPSGDTEEHILNSGLVENLGEQVVMIENDVLKMNYDFKVIGGSMMLWNRYAQSEYYMEMYKNGLIDQVEVLKKSEVVDSAGVLERMGQIQQLQAQIEQLTNELKTVTGDLQTRDREVVHLKTQVEVSKEVEKIRGSRNRMEAAEKIHGNVLTNEQKLAKERLRATPKKD